MPGVRGLGNAEERRALFTRAIQMKSDDAACQACLDQLDDYVTAQIAGVDYLSQFPEVALHLDACVECAGAYARLYELELSTASNQLPEMERTPEPDLSFLIPGATGPLSPAALQARLKAAALAEKLRTAVRRLGNRLTLQLSIQLLPLLRPAAALAAFRAPSDAERYAEVLISLEPDESLRPELPITLKAYRDSQHPEECLVEVVVEPEGRSWPDLGGVTVALVLASERQERVTDAWGMASFEGIPVSRLAELTVDIPSPK